MNASDTRGDSEEDQSNEAVDDVSRFPGAPPKQLLRDAGNPDWKR
jgi:hypothetical protein